MQISSPKMSSPKIKIFALIVLMLGSGITATMLGYRMGYESLKGVSTPDINPAKKLTKKNNHLSTMPKEFVAISEEKILKQIRVYKSQQTEKANKKTNSKKDNG